MVHGFRRPAREPDELTRSRARRQHATIGGLDAEAYLAMTKGRFGRSFTPYASFVPRLLEILDPDEALVLDLGSGPGPLEDLLLGSDPQIRMVAVDASADMLAIVERELRPFVDCGRLTTLRHDPEEGPLPALRAPVAVLKGTAHHLCRLKVAFEHILTGMQSSCVLVVQDFRRGGDPATVLPFIEDLLGLAENELAIYSRILGYVDSRRVSYSNREIASALRGSGWEIVTALLSSDEVVQVAGLGLDAAQVAEIRGALTESFGPDGFEHDMEVNNGQET